MNANFVKFRKFSSTKEIPKEFITKAVKLQGKVIGIQPLNKSSVEDTNCIIHLNVKHIPIISLGLFKIKANFLQEVSTSLKVELLAVRPTVEAGNLLIQQTLKSNPLIWFRLYGVDYEKNLLYASVMLRKVNWVI